MGGVGGRHRRGGKYIEISDNDRYTYTIDLNIESRGDQSHIIIDTDIPGYQLELSGLENWNSLQTKWFVTSPEGVAYASILNPLIKVGSEQQSSITVLAHAVTITGSIYIIDDTDKENKTLKFISSSENSKTAIWLSYDNIETYNNMRHRQQNAWGKPHYKYLKPFNLCVRCKRSSGNYILRKLIVIYGILIEVDPVDGDNLKSPGDFGTCLNIIDNNNIRTVSNIKPEGNDENPHEFTLPIKPITADELSAILTSEA